jgi:hypothetical protein
MQAMVNLYVNTGKCMEKQVKYIILRAHTHCPYPLSFHIFFDPHIKTPGIHPNPKLPEFTDCIWMSLVATNLLNSTQTGVIHPHTGYDDVTVKASMIVVLWNNHIG